MTRFSKQKLLVCVRQEVQSLLTRSSVNATGDIAEVLLNYVIDTIPPLGWGGKRFLFQKLSCRQCVQTRGNQ